MNLTISAHSINLSISMLFHTLHTLSMLTGPNIFLSICLSKMRRLFSSFAGKVQVYAEYGTTGLFHILFTFLNFAHTLRFLFFVAVLRISDLKRKKTSVTMTVVDPGRQNITLFKNFYLKYRQARLKQW